MSKIALFVMKSALFVQANVAVSTKLTSKVPFLFGNFDVFKKNSVTNVQFRYGMTGNISGKYFLGALSISQSAPGSRYAHNLLMLPTPLPGNIVQS
jgi:hypothetical protein